MKQDYKLLKDIPISAGREKGPYESEVHPPWEKDDPTPGQFHIGMRHYLDQPRSQDDVKRLMTGEMFHYLGSIDPRTKQPVNPKWYGLKQQFIKQLSPNDYANDFWNWVHARRGGGETRSFPEWQQQSSQDQFIGGTMFPLSGDKEWIDRARDLPKYNPQQSQTLERLRQLLMTGE